MEGECYEMKSRDGEWGTFRVPGSHKLPAAQAGWCFAARVVPRPLLALNF